MSDKKISKELKISSSELEKMTPSQLETFAEKKSKFILEKIDQSIKKISDAKCSAEYANNMSSGWFGKTRKKADVTANALIATNEAVAEMNDLLQESIRFTCLSLSFAQVMSKHMSALIVNGFKNRDGEFIKLSSDSEEQALYIVRQAESFANNQLKVETKQAEQNTKIDNLAAKVSKTEIRLNEKDSLDEEQNKKLSNIIDLLSEKEKIDIEQSRRLEELGALFKNKDIVDKEQEKAISKNKDSIKLLFDYMKQKDILDKEQTEGIRKLKIYHKKLIITLIIISSLALVSSIASIVLKFIIKG